MRRQSILFDEFLDMNKRVVQQALDMTYISGSIEHVKFYQTVSLLLTHFSLGLNDWIIEPDQTRPCVVMHHGGGGGGVGRLHYSDILFSLPQASDALYKVTLMDWLMGSLFAQPHG